MTLKLITAAERIADAERKTSFPEIVTTYPR